jgi:hypothetical protein
MNLSELFSLVARLSPEEKQQLRDYIHRNVPPERDSAVQGLLNKLHEMGIPSSTSPLSSEDAMQAALQRIADFSQLTVPSRPDTLS